MARTLLIRGMLVGLLAGLLVFTFAKTFGEPQVDRAITFETAMDEAKVKAEMAKGMPAPPDEPELVSRPVQASYGLATGVFVYSAAFGGLFALVFAFIYGRVGHLRPRAVSALLAAGGFVAVYLVPILKYPANPPSIGQPDTIVFRTEIFTIMIVISVAAMVGAAVLRQRLVPSRGAWSATLIAAACYAVVIIAAWLLLPPLDETPEGFPAAVLWKFRIASLGMQFIMWTTLGLVFGELADRILTSGYGLPRANRPRTVLH
ncbi:MAG: CbtA family protein [Acidisphaera sp.]|nr:CbtA family protein [Acidisphaera sp.]